MSVITTPITVCPVHIYIVSILWKLDKTSWTHSIKKLLKKTRIHCFHVNESKHAVSDIQGRIFYHI